MRIGDVTEVCSRTENSSISPGRVMLVFMSSSVLMGSLVSGVKDTLRADGILGLWRQKHTKRHARCLL